MPDPVFCTWCRCKLTDAEDAWSGGFCHDCLIEKLIENPSEGIPLRPPGDGKHPYAFICTRCGGSGHVYVSIRTPDTWCFACGGDGFIIRDREEVQRMARWSGTYQRNRVPETRPGNS